jgi:hypothetical protein
MKCFKPLSLILILLANIECAIFAQDTWAIPDNHLKNISCSGRVLLAENPGEYADAILSLCSECEQELKSLKSHASLHVSSNVEWNILCGPKNQGAKTNHAAFVNYIESKLDVNCPSWWVHRLKYCRKPTAPIDPDAAQSDPVPTQVETSFEVTANRGCTLKRFDWELIEGVANNKSFSLAGTSLVLVEEKIDVEKIAVATAKDGSTFLVLSTLEGVYAAVFKYSASGKIDWIQEIWGGSGAQIGDTIHGDIWTFDLVITEKYCCVFGEKRNVATLDVYSIDKGTCELRFNTDYFD